MNFPPEETEEFLSLSNLMFLLSQPFNQHMSENEADNVSIPEQSNVQEENVKLMEENKRLEEDVRKMEAEVEETFKTLLSLRKLRQEKEHEVNISKTACTQLEHLLKTKASSSNLQSISSCPTNVSLHLLPRHNTETASNKKDETVSKKVEHVSEGNKKRNRRYMNKDKRPR